MADASGITVFAATEWDFLHCVKTDAFLQSDESSYLNIYFTVVVGGAFLILISVNNGV